MQAIKLSLFIFFGFVVLAIVFYVVKLELFAIPAMLYSEWGQVGVTVHVLGIIFLIVGSMVAGSWIAKSTIFGVQEKLVANHLNNLTTAITNLATGAWMADSDIQKNVFTTGAKLGYSLRNEVTELDRGQIVDGIGRMALPETRQLPGQSADVIGEMDSYLNDMDARKQRLSS